mmetsp:Transcript_29698/g.58332  ORF Transcript_29698/g.58332 Transcript_29698/m.58332 type:complete len:112 (-) Transcript_29698:834-1169(-)
MGLVAAQVAAPLEVVLTIVACFVVEAAEVLGALAGGIVGAVVLAVNGVAVVVFATQAHRFHPFVMDGDVAVVSVVLVRGTILLVVVFCLTGSSAAKFNIPPLFVVVTVVVG